jgi:hypothetical protein
LCGWLCGRDDRGRFRRAFDRIILLGYSRRISVALEAGVEARGGRYVLTMSGYGCCEVRTCRSGGAELEVAGKLDMIGSKSLIGGWY